MVSTPDEDRWDFNSDDGELLEDSRRISALHSGAPANPGTLYVWIQVQKVDAVEQLLSAGVSANARLRPEDAWIVEITKWWNCYTVPRQNGFSEDSRQWFPLYQAAVSDTGGKEERRFGRAGIMAALLRHDADPYARFQQPLKRFKSSVIALFPRDEASKVEPPRYEDEDTEYTTESTMRSMSTRWADREYAPRIVIHAILQDGGTVKPMLDFPKLLLDLEHRDPQGRTLVLPACRSAIGADASVDASLGDVPFGLSQEPPTILEALINRGANLLAVDSQGKNALHQLFDAYDSSVRPPIIRRSVQTILARYPALASQPDHAGIYPLHAALQRLRRYRKDMWSHDHDHTQTETVIDDLAAGVDPHACDSRGNTALHYLADNALADQRFQDEARRLFYLFIQRGVDVNARNKAGRSALELLLDDPGEGLTCFILNERRDSSILEKEQAIDAEIFHQLDTAGLHWTDRDPAGNTALHLVARHHLTRAPARAEFLLSKGVDPMLPDKEGRTAVNIAAVTDNHLMLNFFRDKGILESKSS